MTRRFSRRQFVATAAAGVAAPTIVSAVSWAGQNAAPSDRIQLGFIGVGMMGRGHLSRFLGQGDVQVVAVCDVVEERREHARKTTDERYAERKSKGEYKGCAAYVDFRELLARDDIDAVVISTPDHWHAIPCVQAAQAKKDVYCEKPLTHNVVEGRRVVQAAVENKIVFQTGSQQRSEFGGRFRQAVEYVRNGRIGQVKTVRVGVGGPAVPCDLPEEPLPDGTAWDLWLGPAPHRGFNEILCPQGIHRHFPAWRKYREYAGGGLADMGAHHFDIAQWALQQDGSGPVKLEPPAERATSGLKYTYADGVQMFHGGPSGCTFEGERGTIYVDRSKLTSDPEEILAEPLGEDAKRVYHSTDHRRNWIDCIRSREQPICHAEIGHRSASICLIGNIAYWLGRTLQWDPAREQFAGDDEANQYLWREPRKPWTL